jgi:hypothetical protein
MSDEERDKKMDELLEIIRSSPAMNGGFVKLSDAVEKIQESNIKMLYELQLVKTNQGAHIEKIDALHRALYDPDTGLYRRVTNALESNDKQTEDIKIANKNTQELQKKVGLIETKNATIERVAGEDLKELRATISIRKNMMRAWWAFTAAALAGIAKFLWDTVPKLF